MNRLLSRLGVFATLTFLVMVCGQAFANNVPGSASFVEDFVDRQVATRVIDTVVNSALKTDLFPECESRSIKDPVLYDCEWSLNARGGTLFLDGSVSGLDYKSTANFGTLTLARRIGENTSLVGGILMEQSEVETAYNIGSVDGSGIGGTIGLVHRMGSNLTFNVFGGVEFLAYDVSRSAGQFSGEYDARRYFIDSSVSGDAGDDDLWMVYRLGGQLIHQNNDGYTEFDNGVASAFVDDTDFTALSVIGDFKIGQTYENLSPCIQLTANYAVLNETAADLDGTDFTGRLGTGFDYSFNQGYASLSSGAIFSEDGYQGFDIKAGLSFGF
jgi:hypothetical protein